MKNLIPWVDKCIRVGLSVVILMTLSGCAARRMPIFASTSSTLPPLAGKRVAVLPPAALDGEAQMSMETEKAMDAAFSGEIAGICFTNGQVLQSLLKQHPEEANQLLRQVRGKMLPLFTSFGNADGTKTLAYSTALPFQNAKNNPKNLFDSDMVAGQRQKLKYSVSLNLSSSEVALAPEQLDSPLLKSLNTDYVLTTVPFGHYWKTKVIWAIYGILPCCGSGGMGCSPQGLFALYESQSGKKVWEGHVGTEAGYLGIGRIPGELPESTHIVLGAAYLLTKDVEISLGRILPVMAPQKKK